MEGFDKQRKERLRKLAPRGEKCSAAKLKEQDVILIKARLKAGEAIRALATEFSVTYSTISSIKVKRTWRHVK